MDYFCLADAIEREDEDDDLLLSLAGSDVPVETLVDHLEEYGELSDFLSQYPGVNQADAQCVVSVWRSLRDEVGSVARKHLNYLGNWLITASEIADDLTDKAMWPSKHPRREDVRPLFEPDPLGIGNLMEKPSEASEPSDPSGNQDEDTTTKVETEEPSSSEEGRPSEEPLGPGLGPLLSEYVDDEEESSAPPEDQDEDITTEAETEQPASPGEARTVEEPHHGLSRAAQLIGEAASRIQADRPFEARRLRELRNEIEEVSAVLSRGAHP